MMLGPGADGAEAEAIGVDLPRRRPRARRGGALAAGAAGPYRAWPGSTSRSTPAWRGWGCPPDEALILARRVREAQALSSKACGPTSPRPMIPTATHPAQQLQVFLGVVADLGTAGIRPRCSTRQLRGGSSPSQHAPGHGPVVASLCTATIGARRRTSTSAPCWPGSRGWWRCASSARGPGKVRRPSAVLAPDPHRDGRHRVCRRLSAGAVQPRRGAAGGAPGSGRRPREHGLLHRRRHRRSRTPRWATRWS